MLAPRAILERLDGRLELLKAVPGAGLPARQRTLRTAIEWSYELLDPEQQGLFTSLGVFVGGFTLSGAEFVAEQDRLGILEGVESLLRKNLLRAEPASGDEPRLGMLETIRAYAVERLTHGGDERPSGVATQATTWCSRKRRSRACGARGNASGSSVSTRSGQLRAALTWAVEAARRRSG